MAARAPATPPVDMASSRPVPAVTAPAAPWPWKTPVDKPASGAIKKAYAKGFCKVAEEIGYEPSALYKFARATPMTDALGAVFGGMLPLGGVAGGIGAISGGFTNDFGKHDENEAMAFVPGVGAYRLAKRINSQVNREQLEANDLGRDKVKPVRHAVAEKIGPIASMALSTLLGAGIGRLVNKKKGARTGAKIGLGAGGIASLIGMIAAAKKRRRTKEEQFDADEKSVLPKYLVPGAALYGMSKRLGRSQGDRDDAESGRKSKK